jgi:hypothetical protein
MRGAWSGGKRKKRKQRHGGFVAEAMRHSGRDLRLRESMRRPIGDSTTRSPPHTTGKFFVVLERGEERTGELVISSQKFNHCEKAMQDCFPVLWHGRSE